MHKLGLSFIFLTTFSACAPDDFSAGVDTDTSDLTQLVSPDHNAGVAARPAPLPAECGGLQEVAKTVLNSYQQCDRDSDCKVEFVKADCLNSLMCPVPVSTKSDVAGLRRQAAALSFAYQKACTTVCAVASCAGPKRTYCDEAEKRCKSSF